MADSLCAIVLWAKLSPRSAPVSAQVPACGLQPALHGGGRHYLAWAGTCLATADVARERGVPRLLHRAMVPVAGLHWLSFPSAGLLSPNRLSSNHLSPTQDRAAGPVPAGAPPLLRARLPALTRVVALPRGAVPDRAGAPHAAPAPWRSAPAPAFCIPQNDRGLKPWWKKPTPARLPTPGQLPLRHPAKPFCHGAEFAMAPSCDPPRPEAALQ